MAKLLKTDGTTVEVTPANGRKFTLAEAQKLVGGYVEVVPLSRNFSFLVDEDGRMKGKAHNLGASDMARGDLVGDALFCSTEEF